MIRVLYILNSTTPFGGANKSFLVMVTHLRSMGIEPIVVTPDSDGIFAYLQQEGIEVHALSYRLAAFPPAMNFKEALLWLPRLLARWAVNTRASHQVTTLGKRKNIDLIHTNVSVIDIGYHASNRLHIPHVWHIREYGDLDFNVHYYCGRNRQMARYRKTGSYTICITRAIQAYNRLDNWHSSRVIYNGVVFPTKSPAYDGPRNYLLFAGRLEEAKGFLSLLDAYDIYRRQCPTPLPLYVAGDATDKAYKQLIVDALATHGMSDCVKLLGMQAKMATLYREARAVIIPSHNEAFGRVMPEAMHEGCAVIAYDAAGSREQLDNGLKHIGEEIGLRYTTLDQLATHLLAVTAHPEQLAKMCQNAKETVDNLYSEQQYTTQILQLYQQIC